MNFFTELKRRNVFRVGAAYAVASWLLIEVSSVVLPVVGAPEWVLKLIMVFITVGLVIALMLSWLFEITADGLKLEADVDRSQSITSETAKKLDRMTIALLVIGLLVLGVDRLIPEQAAPPVVPVSTVQIDESGDVAPQDAAPMKPAPIEKSIAVLPFVNLSADPENEYFADGLSEELLNKLAQAPDLEVAGRTSSFSYKGKNEDLRIIGSTLGVANILEGSVRKQGNQVRVTAQLIRAEDGFHMWSNTYDRTLEDVFAIQDDIAENVTRELKIVLDEGARNKMRMAGIRNVDAFVAFQKGKELFTLAHGTEASMPTLKRAVVFFDQAIELVPGFAAAYWAKSDYYAHILREDTSSQEQRFSALDELRRVLDAAYELSEDPTRKAFIDVDRVLFSDDWSPLTDRIEKALATTECPDPVWIEVATAIGYARQMKAMWQRFMRCDPLNFFGPMEVASATLWLGDAETGIAVLTRAEGVMGKHLWFSGTRQLLLLSLGRIDDALALAPEMKSDPGGYGLGAEALPQAVAGQVDLARESMDRHIAENDPGGSINISLLAALGDRQGANDAAAEIDARPGGPVHLISTVYNCACGAPFDLSATPNFRARIEQAGIPWPLASPINYPAKGW